MKRICNLVIICGLGAGLFWTSVQANDLPNVNLGLTSFVDGGPPAGPGFYFAQYALLYHADQINGPNGKNSGLPDVDLNLLATFSQVIYQSDQKVLLGSKWGMDVIQPIVDFDFKHSAPIGPQANSAGFGDLLVGPFLQWDPIMGSNGPIFMHRIEFQMNLPTGRYSASKALNPGSHFFSIDPYWSGTLFITPKWTTSLRLHYLWSDSNGNPNDPLAVKETQAGQAIHFNWATDYEVIEKHLRLGINAYYLKQITDYKRDGNSVSDTREQAFGIGPGAVYHFSQNNHLFFNTYFEPIADNRPEGMAFILRYVHHF